MNNLSANYERIMEILRKISKDNWLLYQRRKTKMSDLELIALNLKAKYMGLDGEDDLFRKLPETLSSNIERSCLNNGEYHSHCQNQFFVVIW